MRIIEIRPSLLINDPIQRKEFQSVKLHRSGAWRLMVQTEESQARANKKNSKLPSDWRDSWVGSQEDFLYREEFRKFVRGLDRISREDLLIS